MSTVSVVKKYVSRKINSIKWRPAKSSYDDSKCFLTGTWDDENNNLSVWHLDGGESDPALIQEISQPHSVNDIKYILKDNVAIALGNGDIHIYQQDDLGRMELKNVFEKCHSLNSVPVSCTSLSTNGELLTSVGEDGKLILFNCSSQSILKKVESVGGCSETAVEFLHSAEILSGNLQGHLRLWDVRDLESPKATLLSPDQVSIQDLSSHPAQPHLVAAAAQDGTLMLWDMRETKRPLTVIAAHKGPVCEVQFHPTSSDHLFTCGFDGKVLHWDASNADRILTINGDKGSKGLSNAWLTNDVAAGCVDTENLLNSSYFPINSIDIEASTLLAGSDNEAVYIIGNVLFM